MARGQGNQNKNRGQGWHGDSQRHAEAGRKGGKATAQNHDASFYEEIGSKGGQASSGSFEKGSERAREAGRKGGANSSGNQNSQQQ